MFVTAAVVILLGLTPAAAGPAVAGVQAAPRFVQADGSDDIDGPQQPPTLTVGFPDSWRLAAGNVAARVHVDGVPSAPGSVRIVADETDEQLNIGSGYDGSYWLDTTVLAVGSHRVRVAYRPDDPEASVSWTGTVQVLPQAATETTIESPPAGHYGDQRAYVSVSASVRTIDGSALGPGSLNVIGGDGEILASSAEISGWGDDIVRDTVIVPVDGLLPGTYPVTAAWVPSSESRSFKYPTPTTLPSQDMGSMTIRQTPTQPEISSSSNLVHGRTGSVQIRLVVPPSVDRVDGELVARIDGIEFGRVPASATEQTIPLDLTRVLPGSRTLDISYSGSDRLEQSSVAASLRIASGVFHTYMPVITGTPRVGETLVAKLGAWAPMPLSTTYVWMADGVVIPGQNTSKLVVPREATGKRIRVVATGSRPNYVTASSGSNSTSKVVGTFVVSKAPSISGTTKVGSILTAGRGTWSPAAEYVEYQWRLDGRPVLGATTRTWKLPPSARGKRVTVAVTAGKLRYLERTAISPATAAVKAGTFVVPALKITGTAKVGYTLKAVRGTWTPQPSAVKYQWKVGGVVVKGASGSSFKVPASAKGKRVTVIVTGSRAGYTTRTVSALTGVVR